MRVLFLDCFSGISGDMTVGALTDLGVKPSTFEWELAKLDIGDFHMHFERKQQQHIEGIKFGIHEGATHKHEEKEEHHHEEHEHHHDHGHAHEHSHDHGHCHEHEHHDHEHNHGRTHAQIRELITRSDLSEFVKKHALNIFQRIAVAEGKIHGVPPGDVQFHEVGGLDSIADIVCACAGIEHLGVKQVFISELHDGRGWTNTAHGRFPVPAPATLEILRGISVAQTDEEFEMITPTGAAIVAEFGVCFGAMPRIKIEKIGYGLGTREGKTRPNVLRAVLGELEAADGFDVDTIARIETNLDDLSPEITGAAVEKLLAAGALDVFLTPIQMKKNRPGVQLSVLCEDADVPRIANLIFAETTSFGLRTNRVQRLKLDRRFEKVQTPFGEVTVKLGFKNNEIIQVAPEFESCRVVSERSGQPLRAIYQAALDHRKSC